MESVNPLLVKAAGGAGVGLDRLYHSWPKQGPGVSSQLGEEGGKCFIPCGSKSSGAEFMNSTFLPPFAIKQSWQPLQTVFWELFLLC